MLTPDNSLHGNLTCLCTSSRHDHVQNIELQEALFGMRVWVLLIYSIITVALSVVMLAFYSCYNRADERLEYCVTRVLDHDLSGNDEKKIVINPDGVLIKYNGKFLTVQVVKQRLYNQGQQSLFIRKQYQELKEVLPGCAHVISDPLTINYYRRHQFEEQLIVDNKSGSPSAVIDTKVLLIKRGVSNLKYQLRFFRRGTLAIQSRGNSVHLFGIDHIPFQEQIVIPGLDLPGGFRQTEEGVVLVGGGEDIVAKFQLPFVINTHYLMILPLNEKRIYNM